MPSSIPTPKHFLVLDSNDAERAQVVAALRGAFASADIRETSDPEIAETWTDAEEFDCMVFDNHLGSQDGLQFGIKLRTKHPHVALILTTKVGDDMLAANALRSGMSDYIPKSYISVETMRRTVVRAVYIAAQARVIANQRAELENFAYTLAHDFKQPIRQIRTFTSLILEELKNQNATIPEKYTNYLMEATRRLGDLVDVMSQYTLLNKVPETGVIDLDEIIGSAISTLSQYLEEHNARVEANAVPKILGNGTLMLQIMQNLIVNGVKYNRSETPLIRIAAKCDGDHCILEISDNGIGIDEQYLSTIFDPLVRLHSAAEYSGTGLGLTLVRKAVLAQGGRIWCTSTLGKGTTFTVEMLLPGNAKTVAEAETRSIIGDVRR